MTAFSYSTQETRRASLCSFKYLPLQPKLSPNFVAIGGDGNLRNTFFSPGGHGNAGKKQICHENMQTESCRWSLTLRQQQKGAIKRFSFKMSYFCVKIACSCTNKCKNKAGVVTKAGASSTFMLTSCEYLHCCCCCSCCWHLEAWVPSKQLREQRAIFFSTRECQHLD